MATPAPPTNVLTPNTTIAIIGAGSVGSTIAHSLLIRRVVGDLILVDIDEALCKAQVEDLSDSTFLHNVRIRAGSFNDASQAEIIIVTAGAKQRPGDTRLSLIDRNFAVLSSVLNNMKPLRQDAILLLVANPVDVLTSAAQRMSGLPKGQVIGSGTLLDSVRLRRALAARLQVSDAAVHASVIGEHGDSQCVAWSSASVYGNPLMHILPLTDAERKALEHSTRNKAASIIAAKGFTSYGVAATTTMICESIIFDQCHVLPISHWVDDLGCCLSLPAIVGRKGVRGAVKMTLDDEERKLLEKSAQSLKEVLEQCEAYFKKHEEQGQEQSTK